MYGFLYYLFVYALHGYVHCEHLLYTLDTFIMCMAFSNLSVHVCVVLSSSSVVLNMSNVRYKRRLRLFLDTKTNYIHSFIRSVLFLMEALGGVC